MGAAGLRWLRTRPGAGRLHRQQRRRMLVGIGAADPELRLPDRQVASFETDLELVGLPGSLRAVFIRAPWIEDFGPGVEVLASLEAGRPAGEPLTAHI